MATFPAIGGSASGGVQWTHGDPSSMARKLNGQFRKATGAWQKSNREVADELEWWMKVHHAFDNVTGGAQEALTATASSIGASSSAGQLLIIDLYYKDLESISAVRYAKLRSEPARDYSIYIETMQDGKFGVIRPAMDQAEEVIHRRYRGTLVE